MNPKAGERGVVLEVGTRRTLVLLPGGRFRWIATRDPTWAVGQEVWVREPARWRRWAVAAAAAAVAAGVVPPLLGQAAQAATVVVSVDINPSVDLVVNGRQRVVAAQALDGAGQVLLSRARVVGKPVAAAVEAITGAAYAAGYLRQSHPVVLLAEVTGGAQDDALLKALVAQERAFLSAHHVAAAVLTAYAADPRLLRRAASRRAFVSVGRYLLWRRLHASKPTLSLQAVAHSALPALLQAVQTAPPRPLSERVSEKRAARAHSTAPRIAWFTPGESHASPNASASSPAQGRRSPRSARAPEGERGQPSKVTATRAPSLGGGEGGPRSSTPEESGDHHPPKSSLRAPAGLGNPRQAPRTGGDRARQAASGGDRAPKPPQRERGRDR